MKSYLYLAISLLLFSCNSPNKELVITFENSFGIVEGDPVVINNRTIGEVTKVSLDKHYKPLISIYLEEIDHLPEDSKFTIGSKDLVVRAIVIIPGKSKTWLTNSDRITGISPAKNQTEPVGTDFFEQLNQVDTPNQDSIRKELNELNHQLQELTKKTN